jgi:hypothetical protein
VPVTNPEEDVMPIPFQCPKCRARYEVADAMDGKTILCRECEERVSVGGQAAGGTKLTRRNALAALAYGVPGGLLVVAGIYYWSRPLPWERAHRGDDPPFPPGPPRGGPPPGGGERQGTSPPV